MTLESGRGASALCTPDTSYSFKTFIEAATSNCSGLAVHSCIDIKQHLALSSLAECAATSDGVEYGNTLLRSAEIPLCVDEFLEESTQGPGCAQKEDDDFERDLSSQACASETSYLPGNRDYNQGNNQADKQEVLSHTRDTGFESEDDFLLTNDPDGDIATELKESPPSSVIGLPDFPTLLSAEETHGDISDTPQTADRHEVILQLGNTGERHCMFVPSGIFAHDLFATILKSEHFASTIKYKNGFSFDSIIAKKTKRLLRLGEQIADAVIVKCTFM